MSVSVPKIVGPKSWFLRVYKTLLDYADHPEPGRHTPNHLALMYLVGTCIYERHIDLTCPVSDREWVYLERYLIRRWDDLSEVMKGVLPVEMLQYGRTNEIDWKKGIPLYVDRGCKNLALLYHRRDMEVFKEKSKKERIGTVDVSVSSEDCRKALSGLHDCMEVCAGKCTPGSVRVAHCWKFARASAPWELG